MLRQPWVPDEVPDPEARPGGLVERSADKFRGRRGEVLRGFPLGVEDLELHVPLRVQLGAEGGAARQKLVCEHPDGPDVALGVVERHGLGPEGFVRLLRGAAEHLGRHVIQRPEPCGRPLRRGVQGEPEVGQLHRVLVQQHVFRLDVPVQDAARVQVLDGGHQRLDEPLDDFPLCEEHAGALQLLVEVAGLGVLLDEVDVVAVLERGVQLHYVTVVQLGVDLDLADDLLIVHGLHASLVVDLDGADRTRGPAAPPVHRGSAAPADGA